MPHPDEYRNPTLIFGENHSDPHTFKILTLLSSILCQSGYSCFFDETPSNFTLEKKIANIEMGQRNFAKLESTFQKLQLDVDSEEDIKRYPAIQAKSVGFSNVNLYFERHHDYFIYSQYQLLCRSRNLSYEVFLRGLARHNIGYSAIDTQYSCIGEALTSEGKKKRDKHMADAYINSKGPVFGCVGLNHILGIQQEIIRVLSPALAERQYCFFYVFSNSPNEHLEELVRRKKICFPMHVILIDAKTHTETEIIDIIQREIERKRALPLLSARTRISARDGFFKNFEATPLQCHLETKLEM